jgi:hypothetical protein
MTSDWARRRCKCLAWLECLRADLFSDESSFQLKTLSDEVEKAEGHMHLELAVMPEAC